ncbi:MAG: ASPIC/UnbV domain-containing protein [Mariniblastus sp.]|nr:ASPIC/UnbV domain-containing protein [Mariniblastus sp.]
MREDPTKSKDFENIKLWDDQKYYEVLLVPQHADPNGRTLPKWGFKSNSLSGRERNRMFLRWGDNYADVTLVSGADDMADGRSFGLIDFDQDGWTDIALMTLNAPRFKLYRNEMSKHNPGNKPFRFKLVGGQNGSTSSLEFSNRDAIGARILLTFESGKKVMMQKQRGEGFASQNSETLSIGIPSGDSVARLEIRWPSGKLSVVESPDNSKVCQIDETTAD